MKRMTIDKDAHMGDPLYVDVPVADLLSRERAARPAASIRAGERARVDRMTARRQRETTHISVIDRDGTAVAMTHTPGRPSSAITAGPGSSYHPTPSHPPH